MKFPSLINTVIIVLVFSISGPGEAHPKGYSSCYKSSRGHVIDWEEGYYLEWSDFKASSKKSSGFAIATSTSDFEYDTQWIDGKLMINVHVNFYCLQSWKNPRYHMNDVLRHEQLHFDICEIFGRKFYKEITELRNKGKLSRRSAWYLYRELNADYQDYQVYYDEETDYSTNGVKQREWKQRIRKELDDLAEFADYKELNED